MLNHQFTIVSKDKDFYHLANTLGAPPKFIWLTTGNCKNKEIMALLTGKHNEIKNFRKSSKSILVIGNE